MSNSIALDSLPYYDTDLVDHPHLRANVSSLLAVELRQLLPKSHTPNPTNLPKFPPRPPPTAPFLAAELARVAAKKPLPPGEGLDSTRYTLPAPHGKAAQSVHAWQEAHRSALAQLEHQRLRLMNGQILQSSVGSNAWKIQNFTLENTVQRIDKESEDLRAEVEDLNRERKKSQEAGGAVLTRMEKKWTELISGNIQLEIGCITLEAEIAQLQEREAALKARLAAA